MNEVPVVILSYNRPQYLKAVLDSLNQQDPVNHYQFSYHLFQDGPRLERNEIALTDQCVQVFQSCIPSGMVHYNRENLGIALNYDRAECFVFEELQAEYAFFFEDDLVVQPHYLQLLNTLARTFLNNSEVGMVTCCGPDYHPSLEYQKSNEHRLIHAGFNWGFALKRNHWLDRKVVLEPYLSIVKRNDYRFRDKKAIWNFYRSLGFGPIPTSQDRAKNLASLYLGVSRLNTTTVNARYIGAVGEHFDTSQYNKRGFDRQTLYPKLPSIKKFSYNEETLATYKLEILQESVDLAMSQLQTPDNKDQQISTVRHLSTSSSYRILFHEVDVGNYVVGDAVLKGQFSRSNGVIRPKLPSPYLLNFVEKFQVLKIQFTPVMGQSFLGLYIVDLDTGKKIYHHYDMLDQQLRLGNLQYRQVIVFATSPDDAFRIHHISVQ
ncbi:glycosyltransferase family A protein [Marinobacterium weihaiense]|uniref:Glycosyltransferase family 2 protein n=1 Tax=Marinobacterium weihaiense TaxID=2851016 RepID=A0ABS6MF09_9GAMM|nr:glycosyltransferase family 2 protein [Marinobacterium weihaiense]MBV0934895.1 glycosyltransferase family 2 protein [Marinobacterium weihaiense]